MAPELTRSSILKGQNALIVGVANDRSIAWGCAQAMHLAGAEIAMTYLNEKARPYVEPLASAVEASLLLPLEVRDTAQVDALFAAIASNWGRLDILVHSIAFAPPQALEGFLRKTGLSQDQLQEREGVYFAVIERAGRPAADILGESIKRITPIEPTCRHAQVLPRQIRYSQIKHQQHTVHTGARSIAERAPVDGPICT